jgi:hypothetical protein
MVREIVVGEVAVYAFLPAVGGMQPVAVLAEMAQRAELRALGQLYHARRAEKREHTRRRKKHSGGPRPYQRPPVFHRESFSP